MISVVIPAYNEEKLLGRCLDSLQKQRTKEKFEVIIVNNNSTDHTQEITDKYRNKLPLKIIVEKKKGRGAARKAGFKVARGEIILSTDADTIIPDFWVGKMANVLRQSNAVALAATGRIDEGSHFTKLFYIICQFIFLHSCRMLYGYYWLTGFNFAIYQSAYQKSGGFDDELNANEDCTLAKKVNKIGKIAFTNNMPVIISSRRFRKGFMEGLWMYLKIFLTYFILRRENSILSDIR